MKRAVCSAWVFCLLCFGGAGQASAQFVLSEALDVGISGLFYASGSFLDEPPESGIPYPGFGGFNPSGGGLALDVRYLGIVGVEIDLLFTEDIGGGEINDQDVEIGQEALHVPILLKVQAPLAIFKPNLFIGYEFVFVEESKAETVFSNIGSEASDYEVLTFGLGFEIALPIPSVDIRIPLSLRGSVNLDTPETVEERTTVERGQITYNSEWKFHTGVTLGVAWYFL